MKRTNANWVYRICKQGDATWEEKGPAVRWRQSDNINLSLWLLQMVLCAWVGLSMCKAHSVTVDVIVCCQWFCKNNTFILKRNALIVFFTARNYVLRVNMFCLVCAGSWITFWFVFGKLHNLQNLNNDFECKIC